MDALKAFRDAELTSLNRVEETNASLRTYIPQLFYYHVIYLFYFIIGLSLLSTLARSLKEHSLHLGNCSICL